MASLVDLITNLQTALTTGGSPFRSDTCFLAFDPQQALKTPPGDQFLVIQPNSTVVQERTWATGPSANYVYRWHCTLWLFLRLNVDETGRETSYLLDANFGSVQLADTMVTLLQNYVSSDGYGYHLDEVIWPNGQHDTNGWAATELRLHSDLVGRSAA